MDNKTVNELVADTRDFFKIEMAGDTMFINEYCLNMDQSLSNYNSETGECEYTIDVAFMRDSNDLEQFKALMEKMGLIKNINLYKKIYDKDSKSYKYSDPIIQLSANSFTLDNVSCRIDPLFDGYYRYQMRLTSKL